MIPNPATADAPVGVALRDAKRALRERVVAFRDAHPAADREAASRAIAEPGYRGIPEPRVGCPVVMPEAIEWVLVPGVAFDADGGRLRYGGGFYDRLLPLLGAGVPRVAGAFELQIVARVPTAPHDCRVDVIVTESRALTVTRE